MSATASATPRVSVLMAVSEVGPHFDEAMRSTLAQSFGDFELLVLLNGAAASQVDALRAAFTDPRLRWVTLGLRQLSYALNRGTELARGEYLARMDADDVCSPERFARQVALLDRRPEIAVVGSQVRVIDDHANPLPRTRLLPVEPEAIRRLQFAEGGVAHPAVMMRRAALIAVGGYMGGHVSQDLELWLRMRRAGLRFANVDAPLLCYRIHRGQHSTARRGLQYAEACGVFTRELLVCADPRFALGMVQTLARRIRATWPPRSARRCLAGPDGPRDDAAQPGRRRTAVSGAALADAERIQAVEPFGGSRLGGSRWCQHAGRVHVDHRTPYHRPPSMPRVSVLMPVADLGDHFDAALRSLLDQTFTDLEVVLALNGRACGLGSALRDRYPDPRITIVVCGLRQAAYARNRAFESSSGEYLAAMDADDISDPTRIAEQVALLDAHPEVGVVGCQARLIDSNGLPLPRSRRLPTTPEAIRRLQFAEGAVVAPSVMMRRRVFVEAGGYSAGVEDLDLWLRLRRLDVRFANLDRTLLSYRIHPNQESTSRRRQQYAEACGMYVREMLIGGDPRFVRGLAQTLARCVRAALRDSIARRRSYATAATAAPTTTPPAPEVAAGTGSTMAVPVPAPAAQAPRTTEAGGGEAADSPPTFSLVVSTLGRVAPMEQLLASLERQTFGDFEVVVVDQNDDDRLDALLTRHRASLRLTRIRSARGLSLGRNAGLAIARGRIVAFPDDDCWYAEDTLERVAKRFADVSLDGLSTWIGETPGTDGLGRRPWGVQARIGHGNLFRLPISASLFVRHDALLRDGIAFDERIGAGRRIGAGEETWFVHQLLDRGARIEYDGSIRVHHPVLPDRDPGKAWSYGLGFGYVCRRLIAAGQPRILYPLGRALLRSAGAAAFFALRGDIDRSRTFAARLGSIVIGFVSPPLDPR